ncbi:carbohydrate ABC transporter permease [Cohnella silvisoli]|uniref:Carbohydrate ABC transporter permease n=1 Tax=Cohnella silvisoli TaxID=2873699 RepID=A0ABV1KP09_9BACL|nr:carbohydrate ABC transporter permease [Cohnella silvisoli]MCD9020318.1 carbohydrate ABC transporter permease [Cohnella silvisoli]
MTAPRLKLSNVLIYAFLTLFALFCFLPMLLVFMISITTEDSIRHNGYSLFPNEFSLAAYRILFHDASIVLRSYGISLFITVAGTLCAVMITAMASYTLFNRAVRYRNHMALFFFFTMLFNGGIVPWYMICRELGLNDNIFAMLIPSLLFSAFNLFLTRNYMLSLPYALVESAKIDGANDAIIAFRVIFPLCKPVLATIALFYGLAYWNDWWNAIMLVSDQKLYPVQYFLFKLQSDIQMMTLIQGASNGGILPTESVKMSTAILTIGPIVLMYPYLQRYFVKGLVVGSIKG